MAKKRKLRSTSEPTAESNKAVESEPQQEQEQPPQEQHEIPQERIDEQQTSNPETTEEEQKQELENMAVDEETHLEDEQEQQVEEENREGEQNQGDIEEKQPESVDASDFDAPSESVQVGANGNEEGDENEDESEDLEDEPVENLLEPFTKEQLQSLVKQAVEKHPEFIESVRELADVDPVHRKIFVHGLGWDATAETLTNVFGKYGEIEDCKAVTDKVSGKSKGYAFILFKHRSGARKALKQPQKKIGNRTTSCQLASAGPVPAPPPVAAPVSEYTQRKIFVSNVNAEVDPQRLLEFFKQFGEVEEGPLGLDKQTGKPKGFALFVYKSVEGAKKALEEPNKTFDGYTLYCQKAIDGPKGSKGYHQHQNQHQRQHHSHHHQPHYHSRREKNKYSSAGGPTPAHLMAPSGPGGGYNPGVGAAQGLNPALGQALTALLTTQGAGLGGISNLLGGIGGAPVNQAGPPAGYGNQAPMSYGNQPGMQPGYQVPNPQMGQSSSGRPHPAPGAPYMGH